MAYMLTRIKVDDYETWKQMFDSDPPQVRAAARTHRIMRNAEDPNELFIQLEFGSRDDARAAREKLRSSGVLERVDLKAGPTVLDEAETVTY